MRLYVCRKYCRTLRPSLYQSIPLHISWDVLAPRCDSGQPAARAHAGRWWLLAGHAAQRESLQPLLAISQLSSLFGDRSWTSGPLASEAAWIESLGIVRSDLRWLTESGLESLTGCAALSVRSLRY